MAKLDQLIDDLAADVRPVRARSTSGGRAMLALVAVATIAAVVATFGMREDVRAMHPVPMLAVAAGLMLMVAAAAGSSAVRMARPQVGAAASSAPWMLAALMLVPLISLAELPSDHSLLAGLAFGPGVRCFEIGLAGGVFSAAFLTIWLRRGAPVAPERAAWLVGLAAGGVGALALTLACPRNELLHLGIWHVAVVPVAAILARLVLPRFLRW